jgi:UDP-N-acetylglucosamine--N-acetylmuramyl-(pentapeptide) pyrophosphoryl-undecaprenol N-acetylglucosamine transferase
VAEGFDPARPLLVVLGGSQGAGALNRFVAAELRRFQAAGLQVLHQAGPGRRDELPEPPPESAVGFRCVEFVADVPRALTAASIVLCRGGASTLAEVAALRRSAWVVPYPHHPDRHQERNARELGGGVELVPEARLGPGLADELVRAAGPAGERDRRARRGALEQAFPSGGARRVWEELLALRPVSSARA